ncbi:MAG: PAS domain S-box protein [Dehalococcoidia bacterium]|nr:PAS domain S-box protein [Dehalococcoidia bacterium]MDH4367681.1 PAS domain S-box protein [Dehalococcoidia bacterium]
MAKPRGEAQDKGVKRGRNVVHRKAGLDGAGTESLASKRKRKQMERAVFDSEERYRLIAEHTADAVWTVDMNMRLTYISPSITPLLGYSVQEAMAKPMREIFAPTSFKPAMGLLKEELRVESKKQKGVARSRMLDLELTHKNGSLVPVEVKYTVLRDTQGRPVEVLAIARDINERKQALEEPEHSTGRLIRAMEHAIQAMTVIAEMRDPHTAGHQQRTTQLACAIAEQMGLSKEQIIGLRLAGLIHDIGKVRVPAEILTNPGGLSEPEFMMIRAHPVLGYEILKAMDFPWPVAQIVLQHHERMNGSGYPSGLSGEDIIVEARILGVADVVEAMASHRPYRAAPGINKALAEISQNKGVLYDSQVVDACLTLFRDREFEFEQHVDVGTSLENIYQGALQSWHRFFQSRQQVQTSLRVLEEL